MSAENGSRFEPPAEGPFSPSVSLGKGWEKRFEGLEVKAKEVFSWASKVIPRREALVEVLRRKNQQRVDLSREESIAGTRRSVVVTRIEGSIARISSKRDSSLEDFAVHHRNLIKRLEIDRLKTQRKHGDISELDKYLAEVVDRPFKSVLLWMGIELWQRKQNSAGLVVGGGDKNNEGESLSPDFVMQTIWPDGGRFRDRDRVTVLRLKARGTTLRSMLKIDERGVNYKQFANAAGVAYAGLTTLLRGTSNSIGLERAVVLIHDLEKAGFLSIENGFKFLTEYGRGFGTKRSNRSNVQYLINDMYDQQVVLKPLELPGSSDAQDSEVIRRGAVLKRLLRGVDRTYFEKKYQISKTSLSGLLVGSRPVSLQLATRVVDGLVAEGLMDLEARQEYFRDFGTSFKSATDRSKEEAPGKDTIPAVKAFLALYKAAQQNYLGLVSSSDLGLILGTIEHEVIAGEVNLLNNDFQALGISVVPVSDGEDSPYRIEYSRPVSKRAVFYLLALLEGIDWNMVKRESRQKIEEIEELMNGVYLRSESERQVAKVRGQTYQNIGIMTQGFGKKIFEGCSPELQQVFLEGIFSGHRRGYEIVPESKYGKVIRQIMTGQTDRQITDSGVSYRLLRKAKKYMDLQGIVKPDLEIPLARNGLSKLRTMSAGDGGKVSGLGDALRSLGYHPRGEQVKLVYQALVEAGIEVSVKAHTRGRYYFVRKNALPDINKVLSDNPTFSSFHINPVTRISGDRSIPVPATTEFASIPAGMNRRSPHQEGPMVSLGRLLYNHFGQMPLRIRRSLEELLDGYSGSVYRLKREGRSNVPRRGGGFYCPANQKEALIVYFEEKLKDMTLE